MDGDHNDNDRKGALHAHATARWMGHAGGEVSRRASVRSVVAARYVNLVLYITVYLELRGV